MDIWEWAANVEVSNNRVWECFDTGFVSNYCPRPSVLAGFRQHTQEALPVASPRSHHDSDLALILPQTNQGVGRNYTEANISYHHNGPSSHSPSLLT